MNPMLHLLIAAGAIAAILVLTGLAVGLVLAVVVLACLCWSVLQGRSDDRDRVRRIRQCVLLGDLDAHDDALVRTLEEIQGLPIASPFDVA